MELSELKNKSIVILGLGQEGLATFDFLRTRFPDKLLGLADQSSLNQLSAKTREAVRSDANIRLHLDGDYLASLAGYEVIVKSPGIPSTLPAIQQALNAGKRVTSHTALFFANCPGTIIGVTGTKGKSTTASLIQEVLLKGGLDSHLVGNIGNPPFSLLQQAGANAVFVYELSSYQLERLQQSPHMAILLNVVPDHLDYHEGFDSYVQAKQNITRYQSGQDYLVYNAAFDIPCRMAAETRAQPFPFSLEGPLYPGCFVAGSHIIYCPKEGRPERVIRTEDVPLPGTFNLQNVLAAVAAGKLLGVGTEEIAKGIRGFQPLEHRFELVGTYSGITFYNASIATVPGATIEHLNALGQDVQTVLMGGYDRHLDYSQLARRLVHSQVKTLILFPTTGQRIWEALCLQQKAPSALPRVFFVQSMEEAVRLAYRYTEIAKICLHSPASPSFGLFKDYKERGNLFKHYVEQIGKSDTSVS